MIVDRWVVSEICVEVPKVLSLGNIDDGITDGRPQKARDFPCQYTPHSAIIPFLVQEV